MLCALFAFLVLIGNIAAKGSAINGTGSRHEPTSIERISLTETKLVDETRRGGHRQHYQTDERDRGKGGGGGKRREGRGVEKEKEEEMRGGKPSSTGKSQRSSTLTKGILLSESLLPPDGQKSERARCNYRARRKSSLVLDRHGEASRLSKGMSRKPRSALADMPLSKLKHEVEAREHTYIEKTNLHRFYYLISFCIKINPILINRSLFISENRRI